MIIELKTCRSDARMLRKNFTNITTVVANIKTSTSVENPSFELVATDNIMSAIKTINYCYCPTLGRYYYIDNIEMGNGNIITLNCHVDVLQTYGSDIAAMTCLVERQENLYNAYYIDNLLPIRKGAFMQTEIIGLVGNGGGNYNYTLTSTGGE